MAAVIKERLDAQMEKEGIDIRSLNYATREGMYNCLINGPVPLNDINDVATLLGCNTKYLIGDDSSKDGVKHRRNTICILGPRVKSRMKSMGWSYNSLSDYTGLARTTVSYYMSKQENYVSIPTAETLAYGLNCSIKYLTGETENPMRYDKYRIDKRYMPKRAMTKVDTNSLKAFMNKQNITPAGLAKVIHFPSYLIKGALAGAGNFPDCSAVKLNTMMDEFMDGKYATKMQSLNQDPVEEKKSNIYVTKNPSNLKRSTKYMHAKAEVQAPVTESKVLEAKNKVDNSSDLTKVYTEQKEQEKLDLEARRELANKIPEMVKQRKDITIAMSKPSNGMISTGQLLSLAMVTEKHPDLLNLFSEITELDEQDYIDLFNQIKWMVGVLKRNK